MWGASSGGLFSSHQASWEWMERHGLSRRHFPARRDTLKTLTALHAVDPIPPLGVGRLPRLERAPGEGGGSPAAAATG